MYRPLRWLLLALVVALAGCSYVQRLGVYKLEINQGNYVTKDMVERLRPDMTKSQVRLILGTPLVIDVFHADRWDYVYHHEVGGKAVENRRFAVFFTNDKLAKWEGDDAPAAPVYRASTAEEAAKKEPAKSEEKGFFGRLWEKIGF